MDENKLKVLREIGYTIPSVCGLCKHGDFAMSNWGSCKVQTYEHLKHKRTHPLSIHQFGTCSKFTQDPQRIAHMERFNEFVRAAPSKTKRTCRVYKEYCPEHEFFHGAEAEELRAGIEKLIEENGGDVERIDLQRLIDVVDARDSLSYREAVDATQDFDDDTGD